jgi:glycosyltransferase involved in cell wall biosynthesis
VQYVLVTEFGNSHAELLYSHYRLLKKGDFQPVFFLNEELSAMLDKELLPFCVFFSPKESKWKTLRTLLKLLKTYSIQLIIDNSAHSNYLRILSLRLLFNPSVQIVGVCHYLYKLKKSISQKIISLKVKRYFVLSERFRQILEQKKTICFETFYPIYFPDYPTINIIEKKENEIFIGIAGGVMYERRDYLGLLTFIQTMKAKKGATPIKFIILGNIDKYNGKDFLLKVKEKGLEDYFVFFRGFIEDSLFHNYIKQCDFILPLIHTNIPAQQEFLDGKISGAYNLAFAYQIPLLIHQDFECFPDFQRIAIFYTETSFTEILQQMDLQTASTYKAGYQYRKEFEMKEQAVRYLQFIGKATDNRNDFNKNHYTITD